MSHADDTSPAETAAPAQAPTLVSRREVLAGAATLTASSILPGTIGHAHAVPRPHTDTLDQRNEMQNYDIVIVGGGPAGLAAALSLGRARRRVLLCDAGSPRNAAAVRIHNFVTRDGTPPAEFRRIGRAQLEPYTTVETREERVETIRGTQGNFEVVTASGTVHARRIILCPGMIDEMYPIPGFTEAWGHAIFQCPYCHGWEVQGRRWGVLALDTQPLAHGFPQLLQNWTDDVVVFTNDAIEIPPDLRATLESRNVSVETRAISRLVVDGNQLTHIELADNERVSCEVLYAHPPQRHIDLVAELDLDLDSAGYVVADPMTRLTSTPGIYAAGDITTRAQGAILAAASGVHAAGMANHDLSMDIV